MADQKSISPLLLQYGCEDTIEVPRGLVPQSHESFERDKLLCMRTAIAGR